jgi:hypothetical protein
MLVHYHSVTASPVRQNLFLGEVICIEKDILFVGCLSLYEEAVNSNNLLS